jgi:hypothetical protein
MADKREVAGTVLDRARKVVMSERGNQHGDAEDSFQMIADLWTAHLQHTNRDSSFGAIRVTPFDVAQMMVLLKVARSVYGDPFNPDNYIDAAGYSSLAAMIMEGKRTDNEPAVSPDSMFAPRPPKLKGETEAERYDTPPLAAKKAV